jgi:hypothetical protein
MSDSRRALDTLIAEAKQHHVPAEKAVDWARLEAGVMSGIEGEKPALLRDVERGRSGRRESLLRGAAVVLALAAGFAFFVRQERDPGPLEPAPGLANAPASALRGTEGTGEVHVTSANGAAVVATPGYLVRTGDAIDVDGTRAVFERSRKVTWMLEGTGPARARVKAAGEPLVLSLESGAIEAQVAPVPVGEAFAVDVTAASSLVRIAVHGTHLRVTRAGTHVTVDLTEGVVSIGVPPRTGVTYGTLVTAPAHVELDVTDLATLRVEHAPATVRAAVALSLGRALDRADGHEGRDVPAAGRVDPPSSPLAVATSPMPPAPALLVPPSPASGMSGGALRPDVAASLKGESSKNPRETIANAVRDCAASRARSGEVHVTVTSNLRLRVSPSGEVESAQFSPPLLPEIQSCAAETIYKTKLDETGAVTVPIQFSF